MIFRFKDRKASNDFYNSIQYSDLFNNNSIEVIRFEEYYHKEEIIIYCIKVIGENCTDYKAGGVNDDWWSNSTRKRSSRNI